MYCFFIDKTFYRLAQWLFFTDIAVKRNTRDLSIYCSISSSINATYFNNLRWSAKAKINSSSENSTDNWRWESFLRARFFFFLPPRLSDLFCCCSNSLQFVLFIFKNVEGERFSNRSRFHKPLTSFAAKCQNVKSNFTHELSFDCHLATRSWPNQDFNLFFVCQT